MRSEVWRPAARLVTAPREVRGPARQALRPGCEALAARAAEEMLQTEARPPAGKSPRWSAERRASYVIGRRVPRKHPDALRHCASYRVPLHPGACRRSAHPSQVGIYFTTRARQRLGNEIGCLTSEDVNQAATVRTVDALSAQRTRWPTLPWRGRVASCPKRAAQGRKRGGSFTKRIVARVHPTPPRFRCASAGDPPLQGRVGARGSITELT